MKKKRLTRAYCVFALWFSIACGVLNAVAAVLTLSHGHMDGLLNVAFVIGQPVLYRAMVWGLD